MNTPYHTYECVKLHMNMNDDTHEWLGRTITKRHSHTNMKDKILIWINMKNSLLHLQCHFFLLKSQSMIEFSRSLLPRSAEKRPMRLSLEIGMKWHSKCNRLFFILIHIASYYFILLHMCRHSCSWVILCIHVLWYGVFICVTWLVHMCGTTLKMQVIFHKRATICRALLQKSHYLWYGVFIYVYMK